MISAFFTRYQEEIFGRGLGWKGHDDGQVISKEHGPKLRN
jgi:hypothetical protein